MIIGGYAQHSKGIDGTVTLTIHNTPNKSDPSDERTFYALSSKENGCYWASTVPELAFLKFFRDFQRSWRGLPMTESVPFGTAIHEALPYGNDK